MHLMFICGCLEPGCDGVGDYVVRLGTALVSQHMEVYILALNDTYTEDIAEEKRCTAHGSIQVRRFPSVMAWPERSELASDFVREVSPEVVSLQYVPYSFQEKGLPFSLNAWLGALSGEFRSHVMLHEIWLDSPAGWKQRIAAFLQRRLIRKMIGMMKPEVVNVSVPYDREVLGKIGVCADVLPLFGNIYPDTVTQTGRKSMLPERDVPTVLYFGAAPKGDFRQIFINEVLSFCRKDFRGIRLVFTGGEATAKTAFFEALKASLSGYCCEILDLGFLPAGEISSVMRQCDAGISKSKPRYLGKSGAATAMLEHGLPVWLPRWNGKDELAVSFRPELVFGTLQAALYSSRQPYRSLLTEVAERFIVQFQEEFSGKMEVGI